MLFITDDNDAVGALSGAAKARICKPLVAF